MDQLDPKDDSSIFHIFERLNTGGTSLNPQEVRNCIYSGPLNDLLIRLNRNVTWRRIVGSEVRDKRMRDVELILRFLALVEDYANYTKPMKDFLSTFMKDHSFATGEDLARYGALFARTVQQVVKALGSKPFHIRRGLNAAVYDSVMAAFALSDEKLPKNLTSRYQSLLTNLSYVTFVSSSTTDDEVVRARINLARKKLFGK